MMSYLTRQLLASSYDFIIFSLAPYPNRCMRAGSGKLPSRGVTDKMTKAGGCPGFEDRLEVRLGGKFFYRPRREPHSGWLKTTRLKKQLDTVWHQ